MRNRRLRRSLLTEPELNITAFLNLMVILIPFLLISAVFSRVTILDMHIPPAIETSDQPAQEKNEEPPLQINVVIRKNNIAITSNKQGLIQRFQKVDGSYDYPAISELLQNMKDKVPEHNSANILLEADIPYEILIQAMDVVRIVEVKQDGLRVQAALFPEVSIGDAPQIETNK
ncbi:MAG: biopolymer transporter ExbD [Gammaproteobacteria bacterium]|nr:biopolymer transporter ExbD [Gammaproteobacteria bacterium]